MLGAVPPLEAPPLPTAMLPPVANERPPVATLEIALPPLAVVPPVAFAGWPPLAGLSFAASPPHDQWLRLRSARSKTLQPNVGVADLDMVAILRSLWRPKQVSPSRSSATYPRCRCGLTRATSIAIPPPDCPQTQRFSHSCRHRTRHFDRRRSATLPIRHHQSRIRLPPSRVGPSRHTA